MNDENAWNALRNAALEYLKRNMLASHSVENDGYVLKSGDIANYMVGFAVNQVKMEIQNSKYILSISGFPLRAYGNDKHGEVNYEKS